MTDFEFLFSVFALTHRTDLHRDRGEMPYFIPMAALLFTRSRRVDILLFGVLIGMLLFSDFHLGSSSRWGQQVGISLIHQTSTVPPGPPK